MLQSLSIQYLVEVVPHVEHLLSRQGRHNLSQTLQRLLLAVENCQMEPAETNGENMEKKLEKDSLH